MKRRKYIQNMQKPFTIKTCGKRNILSLIFGEIIGGACKQDMYMNDIETVEVLRKRKICFSKIFMFLDCFLNCILRYAKKAVFLLYYYDIRISIKHILLVVLDLGKIIIFLAKGQ